MLACPSELLNAESASPGAEGQVSGGDRSPLGSPREGCGAVTVSQWQRCLYFHLYSFQVSHCRCLAIGDNAKILWGSKLLSQAWSAPGARGRSGQREDGPSCPPCAMLATAPCLPRTRMGLDFLLFIAFLASCVPLGRERGRFYGNTDRG